MAYKNYQVKTDYKSGTLQKPLTPEHRFFANMSYETQRKTDSESQWKFDVTYNWLGKQRFANTNDNPPEFQLGEFSKTVSTLNAQITKVFCNQFEVYVGGENITNVRQQNPILDVNNPFSQNFDTSFVYGPIFGSNYYAGLRFKLK
jgi:hypothetical protein